MDIQSLQASLLEIKEQIKIVEKQYNNTIENSEYLKFLDILNNNYNEHTSLLKEEKKINKLIQKENKKIEENIKQKNLVQMQKSFEIHHKNFLDNINDIYQKFLLLTNQNNYVYDLFNKQGTITKNEFTIQTNEINQELVIVKKKFNKHILLMNETCDHPIEECPKYQEYPSHYIRLTSLKNNNEFPNEICFELHTKLNKFTKNNCDHWYVICIKCKNVRYREIEVSY